ncbi:MAG: SDR family NAD(P)-dependent oxidoreductase [Pseudomonadota bacterium]
MRLTGKICLIVGASSGMGRRTALRAGAEGAHVIAAARRTADCEAVAQAIQEGGGAAEALSLDGTDPASVETALDKVDAAHGRLDCVFNNLGATFGHSRVHETPLERWAETIATNLTAVFQLMRKELPLLMKAGGGVIVNNSSSAGLRGVRNMSDYSAAKWGLIGLTRSAALEYGDEGVRVNAIAPGIIATEKFDDFKAQMPDLFEDLRKGIPGGRFGEMDDIANLVTWLMSDEAKYVSGATFPIDAGQTAG